MFAGAAACISQQLKSRRRSLEGFELLVRALVGVQECLEGRKRGPQVPESWTRRREDLLRGCWRQEGTRGPQERSLEISEQTKEGTGFCCLARGVGPTDQW